ncbi:hypothetical protein J6590_009371 [Homalodisca vitripennis]|nr:hypothetical protein J6590_009371 [Homalodisca vitripennis]
MTVSSAKNPELEEEEGSPDVRAHVTNIPPNHECITKYSALRTIRSMREMEHARFEYCVHVMRTSRVRLCRAEKSRSGALALGDHGQVL